MYAASVEYLNRQRIIPNWGGGLWEHLKGGLSLFVSVYVYASVCDFVCVALLLPFVLGFCLSVFLFFYDLKNFFFLVSIFYFNNFILFYFILFYFIFFFLSFFFFSLLFCAVWMTGSWCSSQASGLCHWGGRAKFRTPVHKRPPSST